MLRYGVILNRRLEPWQRECLRRLKASGTAELACVVRPRRDAATFGNAVAARARVDFWLLFAGKDAVLPECENAPYGIWFFQCGDPERFVSEAPGFWEIYRGLDNTAAAMLRLRPGGWGTLLKSCYLATIRWSVARNAEALLSQMALWPARVCAEIVAGAATYFDDDPIAEPSERYTKPSALQTFFVRFVEFGNRIAEYARLTFTSVDWNVGFVERQPAGYVGKDERADITYLFPRRYRRFVADPFVVVRNARSYLFCEEYDYRIGRGTIAVSEISRLGASTPQTVIAEPFHLSYPQIFEQDGELFCIVESGLARKVCLYRCVEFPHRWQFTRVLLEDFDGADNTIVRHDGRLWLFCTSSRTLKRGYNSHLHIWFADDLLGRWTPHPRNPVKIDARSARPAGPLFEDGGTLYRPSQDCSRLYGDFIRINRIDVLSTTDFRETVVGTLRPPATGYSKGLHTLASAGGWCVVDARRFAFNREGIVYALKDVVKLWIRGVKALWLRPNSAESAAPLPTTLGSSAARK